MDRPVSLIEGGIYPQVMTATRKRRASGRNSETK